MKRYLTIAIFDDRLYIELEDQEETDKNALLKFHVEVWDSQFFFVPKYYNEHGHIEENVLFKTTGIKSVFVTSMDFS